MSEGIVDGVALLLVTYLPSLYAAFSRREAQIACWRPVPAPRRVWR